jgi:hypothetical protein
MRTDTCRMVGWEGVRRTRRDVRANLEALFESRGNERLEIETQRLGWAADCDAMNDINGLTIKQAVSTLMDTDSIWEAGA